MIFSSYGFIFLFLPAVLGGYFLLNRVRYRYVAKLWLVVASFLFYAQGSPVFFPFFLASVVGNYIMGTLLAGIRETGTADRAQSKVALAIGVTANVALLGYYKYTDFFIMNINAVAHTDIALRHIVLPIGISFFTFQLIAFLVDAYRGLTKSYSIIDYLFLRVANSRIYCILALYMML
jgi:D-alanyl-lipoteichoic acid acyltransferase DltB (MBOAT superfamily)